MTDTSPFLDSIRGIPGIRAGWVERIPEIDVAVPREEAVARLRGSHEAAARSLAGPDAVLWHAEQVHGKTVTAVPNPSLPAECRIAPGADGLVTDQAGIVLCILVADCGPVWLADRRSGAIGLLHSGRAGTAANIMAAGLRRMREAFGTRPQDVCAVLGPCIRPPHYETDFATVIANQARAEGVADFHDCGFDTASDLPRFYSYRMEQGRTGRMLAMITRLP